MRFLRHFSFLLAFCAILCVPVFAADDCTHSWDSGVCSECGYVCEHPSFSDSVCLVCGYTCPHDWQSGYCSLCGLTCLHSDWSDGICCTCGCACDHLWCVDGFCNICGFACPHDEWNQCYCSTCGYSCPHSFYGNNSWCSDCGHYVCHDFYSQNGCGVCRDCGYVCFHYANGESILMCEIGYHWCSFCCLDSACVYSDGSFVCSVCGGLNSILAAGGCSHMATFSGPIILLYSDAGHYVYCIEDNLVISLVELLGVDIVHPDECSEFGFEEYPYSLYQRGCFSCSSLMALVSDNVIDSNLCLCWDDDDHYIYCSDCGAFVEVSLLHGSACPHSNSACEVCLSFSALGFQLLGPLPSAFGLSDVLSAVDNFLSGTLNMAAITADTVSRSPILLITFILPCIGFALLLFRRLRR